ncbi:MAG TPA: alkaline phosphatase D family protein, partial [Anaerolineae bacterium]|nr:alkaline phosphatase D family protein [Anaerolineae bacterium]
DTSTDDTDTDVDNTDTLTDTTPITSTTPITTTDTTTATISTDTDTTDETTGSDEDASEEDTSEEDTSEETNTEEEADSEETTQPITTTETTTDTLDTTDTLTETETITTTTTITTTDTTTDTLGTSEPITDTGVMTMTVPMASYPLTMTVNISSATDFTGDVIVTGLHPNTDYYYQAVLVTDAGTSQPIQGIFATAPAHDEGAPLSFVFGSCLGGQGYCRDPETGWQIFNTMQAQNPDFFVITGDSIYVDSACAAPNVPGSEGPFSDLDGFHNRYRYHLGDTNYASFLAQTPVYVTWDDHEIIDDFGGPFLNKYNPALFAEGTQAFFDYWPLRAETGRIYRSVRYGAHAELIILDTRSYRDPNVNWDTNPQSLTPKTMLGAEQFAWLQETLATSDAHWKFIVTSTPLSYPTGFPQPEVDGRDGWANYTERSGYETELMSLLFFLEAQQIDNVIFLTGDTHWPFALSYDPDRDGEANFYEFGSSPLSAINLAPTATPDPTFNPTVLFAEGQFQGTVFNFGHVAVDAEGNLTFRLVDRDGTELYNMTLNP